MANDFYKSRRSIALGLEVLTSSLTRLRTMIYLRQKLNPAPKAMYTPIEMGQPTMTQSAIGSKTSSFYQEVPIQGSHGLPAAYYRLTQLDLMMLAISISACVIGFVAIYNTSAAAWLGQIRQLMVIGLVLSIMGICVQSRVQRTLSAAEVAWGNSTLQNLDAIARLDSLSPKTSPLIRLTLSLLVAIPLALSLMYKQFVGGTIPSSVDIRPVNMSLTTPPDFEITSVGIPLFSSTMMEWWSDAQYNQTYGFNLYVENASRTALLDGPLPDSVIALQNSLRKDQYMLVQANVSAIVANMVMSWDSEQELNYTDVSTLQTNFGLLNPGCGNLTSNNETFDTLQGSPQDMISYWLNMPGIKTDTIWSGNGTLWSTLAVGRCDMTLQYDQGSSFVLTSRTNSYGGRFLEQAQGFNLTVERYEGTWNISNTAATLIGARLVPPGPLQDPSYNFSQAQFGLINHRWRNYEQYYPTMMNEFNFRDPATIYRQKDYVNITTDATFAATMVWSRVTVLASPLGPEYDIAITGPLEYTIPSVVTIQTAAMRRSWELAVILLIFPLMLVITLVLKATAFYGNPALNGIGLVSMLAAVQPHGLELLKGAGFSGDLDRDIVVKFSTVPVDDGRGGLSVGRKDLVVDLAPMAALGCQGLSTKLQRGVLYG